MAFAFPMILLIDIIVYMNFFQWQQESIYEFEQRQIDLQVNYAVTAAAQEMLEDGTNIDTDYSNWGDMTVEPELALDTYVSVLLRNLGYSDSEKNREELITDNMPFFIVAAYDGYYVYGTVADAVEVSPGNFQVAYPKKWSPKLPYSSTTGSGSNVKSIFYNLGGTTYDAYINGVWQADVKYVNDSQGRNYGATEAERLKVVSNTLTKACNSALFSALEGNVEEQWFVPDSFSKWSANRPVLSPSVLTYMSSTNTTSVYEVVTFAVGGSKIDNADFYICYKNEKGEPVYTHVDNRTDVEQRGLTIIHTLTSMKAAAEKGYYYDTRYLRR